MNQGVFSLAYTTYIQKGKGTVEREKERDGETERESVGVCVWRT